MNKDATGNGDFKASGCECVCRSAVSDSCDPMDCSPPGSSVHGILQARILERVATPSSRGSSPPRDGTWVSRRCRQILQEDSSIAGRCEPWGKLWPIWHSLQLSFDVQNTCLLLQIFCVTCLLPSPAFLSGSFEIPPPRLEVQKIPTPRIKHNCQLLGCEWFSSPQTYQCYVSVITQ